MIVPVVAAALWALLASVLLSLLLIALVAGLIALARPSAAARGALWSLVLAAAGIAPVAIFAVMLMRGAVAPEAVPLAPGTSAHGTAAAVQGPAQLARATASAPANAVVVRIPGPPDVAPLAGKSLVALWALGALIGLAGLGRSLFRVRALKARSRPLDGTLATELPWLTTTPGREIYLRLSYETETPIAVGFRRPVILLPTEMATADGLTSIEPLIMHEYAHLARYDDWSNLVQRAIERLLWLNPVVWFLGRHIALEREVAADEAVVARTHDAKVYASTLWRMAQEMRMPEHVVVAPGAMLTRKQISVRIERLLDDAPAGARYLSAAAFALAILAVTGIAALAAFAPPIVLAQATPALETTDAVAPTTPVAPLVLQRVKPPRVVAEASPEADNWDDDQHVDNIVQKAFAEQQRARVLQAKVAQKLAQKMAQQTQTASFGEATRDMLASCIGCDFSRRDLHGVDLSNMTLTGDNFDRANLVGANFANSKLQGLSMQRADLSNANLNGAKMTGIDLSHATLDHANLSNALVVGVDLSHASMAGTATTGMHLIGSSLP